MGSQSKLSLQLKSSIHIQSYSTILTSDGETPAFSISSGILQGDTLSPFLFIIVVDYVLRMSVDIISDTGFQIKSRQSSRHPAEYLTDTDFADDNKLQIVLVYI